MSAASAKPARKPAAKQHDAAPDGSALPLAGNQSPPTAAPAAAPTVSGSARTAPAQANAPTSTDPMKAATAAGEQVVAPPVTSPAPEVLAAVNSGLTPGDLRNLPPTLIGAIAGAGPAMPHVASISAPPTASPTQAVAPAVAAKIAGNPAGKADIAAAASASTSTNANATQNAQTQARAPSAANADAATADAATADAANADAANADAATADAAAQAAMAAVMAQGTSAPSPNSSASSDELATPDIGVTLQGVAVANEAASPAPGGLPAHAAAGPTSASVTAATAASIVQAASASADSGTTDKHSRDNSPDGSVDAAQLLTSNTPSDPASVPTPTFKVSASVDTADFGHGVADRVSMMMDSNLTSAKLQVNPPALGPIEVRIALQAGHAQVWMSSHSAVTRDALESTSSKLREMLNAQGFTQVSVDISQRSFQDRTPQPQPPAYESVSAIGGNSTAPLHQASAAAPRGASSLLDAYA